MFPRVAKHFGLDSEPQVLHRNFLQSVQLIGENDRELLAGTPTSLPSNLRGIIGEDSDLWLLVIKEHVAAAIFGGQNDPLANRPSMITAFPLGIQ